MYNHIYKVLRSNGVEVRPGEVIEHRDGISRIFRGVIDRPHPEVGGGIEVDGWPSYFPAADFGLTVEPREEIGPCPAYRVTTDTVQGNYHFEGVCDDCDARFMIQKTLGEVLDLHTQGRVWDYQFTAYTHLWATGAFRYDNYSGWERVPTDPAARRFARAMLRHAGREVPAELKGWNTEVVTTCDQHRGSAP